VAKIGDHWGDKVGLELIDLQLTIRDFSQIIEIEGK
jgi:hypothetical protein